VIRKARVCVARKFEELSSQCKIKIKKLPRASGHRGNMEVLI